MRTTIFQSLTDPNATTYEVEWSNLTSHLKAPAIYANKHVAPLIKLAVFGNMRSPKGMLRNDANVVAVSGVELDFDNGDVSIDEAALRLRRAGVKAFLFTTASHRPDAPRWRALLPLSAEYPPDHRLSLYEAANAIVGGICDPVSATLSQSYFIGAVDGVPYEWREADGKHLDEVFEPVARPLKVVSDDIRVPEWRHVDLDTLPLDDEARRLIRNGASKGERSEALMSAANALARTRVHPDDIVRVLSDPAYGISAKALEGRRQVSAMEWLMRHTVRKALEAYPPPDIAFGEPVAFGEARPRASLFIGADELTSAPRPIIWLIRDKMERPVLGVLFGGPGSGKSYLAIDWSCCIATGSEWNGHKVTPGVVVYLAGEGFGGMSRRIKAWEDSHGVRPGKRLVVSRRAIPFNDARAFAELISELEAITDSIALIVVDTLARMSPGMDENSAKEMGEFVGNCDRLREKFNATVLVVHHSGHGDKGRARGSIALKAATDFEAGMIADGGATRLFCTKMKEGELFEDMHFEFRRVLLPWPDEDNRPQASSVLVACAAPAKSTGKPRAFKLSQNEQTFLWALGREPIAKAKVREAFAQLHGGTEKAIERAWYRTMQRGLARRWFHDDGTTLTPSLFAIGRDQKGEGFTDTTDTDTDKLTELHSPD